MTNFWRNFADDQNINKLNNYKDLINIGYVPQNSFIFDDTIYNNITLNFINDKKNDLKLFEVLENLN